MSPSRCTLCGCLAERPVRLRWILHGHGHAGPTVVTVSLCLACSNSWCPDATADTDSRIAGEPPQGLPGPHPRRRKAS
jgi:hypothetical protein